MSISQKNHTDLFDISAPSPIDEIYKQLGSERLRIEQQWAYCKALFGSKKKRKVLVRCAPSFFQGLKETYLSDTILSIIQMVDGKGNLHEKMDLRHLRNEIENDGRKSTAVELSDHLSELKNLLPVLKRRREKLVSDRDEHAHWGEKENSREDHREISEIPVEKIGETLGHTKDFLNGVASEYGGITLAYRSYADQGRAEALTDALD